MKTIHRAFEPSTQAAAPEKEQFKAMRPYQLIEWLEEEQEEAEIRHLRRQIRSNGRVGMMEMY
jgi:hypothetical protein